jgi:hypothetical protein
MNYPEYRRLGLPITSSLMESTIKQLSQRVNGTEKFCLGIRSAGPRAGRSDALLPKAWQRWRRRRGSW